MRIGGECKRFFLLNLPFLFRLAEKNRPPSEMPIGAGFSDCMANVTALFLVPLPAGNLREVKAVLVDVLLVLHQLVAHLLIEISAPVAQTGQVL